MKKKKGISMSLVRWIPKRLTDENKWVWVYTAWKFLAQHHVIWQWFRLSSPAINRGFCTSPQHRKKTLEFGIRMVSRHWKNFISTIWRKQFSALCFEIVKVCCQLISKRVGIRSEWIPKNTWQLWRISKKKLNKSIPVFSVQD